MKKRPARGGEGRRLRRFLGLVVAIVAQASAVAHARTSLMLPYASADVWSAAVRFLRVDRGFTIREKDEKAGYILFDFTESARTFHASLELVSLTDEDGRASTDAQLALPELPKRYEAVLLEQLGAKVRQERGAPPPMKKHPSLPSEPARDKDAARPRGEPDAGLPRAPTLPSP